MVLRWSLRGPEEVRESGTLLMGEELDFQFPSKMTVTAHRGLQDPLLIPPWGSPCPRQTVQLGTLALLQFVNPAPVLSVLLNPLLHLKSGPVIVHYVHHVHHVHHPSVSSNILYFMVKEPVLLQNWIPSVGQGVREWTAPLVVTKFVLASKPIPENFQE